jgi:acetylornithine/succinyldiaminopimelate/putrescine aminotransferase
MISLRNTYLKYLAQTSDEPMLLEPDYAEGIYIYDVEGKKYLDLISGISVSNLGHRHPRVVNAVKEQVDKYMHVMVYGEFVQSPQAKFAERLIEVLPENLNKVYLVNSGSEAVEGAMKLAKKFTGRTNFVSFQNCYHGNTQGAMSLLSDDERKEGYGPYLEGVFNVPFNDLEALSTINENTAAVFVETLMGEAGCLVHSQEYMDALYDRCKKMGALLVCDEIQCGFGRTGKMFAFEHYGIQPDIVLFAKGMGGGMPIGAFAASKEIMDVFINNPVLGHITTFGGHPVSSAAAFASLEVLLEEGLDTVAEEKELLFRNGLKHPEIIEVSGKGLMLSVLLKDHETVQKVIAYCLDHGIVTDWFLFAPDRLRIAPPLTIDEESISFASRIICEALG